MVSVGCVAGVLASMLPVAASQAAVPARTPTLDGRPVAALCQDTPDWIVVTTTPTMNPVRVASRRVQNVPALPECIGLPYAVGETWSVSGTHAYDGDTAAGWQSRRNSIDVSDGSHIVRAAGSGRVHFTRCGLLMIDHGAGRWTSYYHVNVAIRAGRRRRYRLVEGAHVNRGDYLGTTGTRTNCGGRAEGAHVHFSVWQIPAGWNGNVVHVEWGINLDKAYLGGWMTHNDNLANYRSYFVRLSDGRRVDAMSIPAQLANGGGVA
jgi:hypothetical protein